MLGDASETAQAPRPTPPAAIGSQTIGIVVIGRNEGERLKICLGTALSSGVPLVYVDSGSADSSVAFARGRGLDVVELDGSSPYTAARGRNAGFKWLLEKHPGLEFVQFVDGDCELCDGWLARSQAVMRGRPDVAIVCGRVRERFPTASIYNRICELEWRQPPGEIDGCGGNMLMRVGAFREVGGFDPHIIAAEDTELCTRLHLKGWKVFSVDADMVRHDAAMLEFSQWWTRMVRAGHAITEGAQRHGQSPARLFMRASRRILVYGLLLPVLVLSLAWPTGGWSMLAFAVYPLQFIKTYLGRRARGEDRVDAAIYASHCVMAKFPQAVGQIIYRRNRWRGSRTRIIEHKRPAAVCDSDKESSVGAAEG